MFVCLYITSGRAVHVNALPHANKLHMLHFILTQINHYSVVTVLNRLTAQPAVSLLAAQSALTAP